MLTMPHLPAMDWSRSNELSSVSEGTLTAHYQYSSGQRARKFVDKGSIKEERIYLGSYEIYRKFTGSSLTPDLERITVHISDDTGRIAMLEKRTIGTDASLPELQRYIYSNHLQSASLELNEIADIISYEEYHPYGTTAYQASNTAINAVAKRYRYTGKERDEESGLYYHGARYYVPWLCRWTACDPLESERAGLSPYDYCSNNPVMKIDPDGMYDGWINTGNKMAYNSAVSTQEEATEVYGSGATFHEVGYTYKSGGSTIVLGENGSFTDNGTQKQSKDDADFNVKESSWGWLGGFASSLYSRFKSGNEALTIQSLKEGLGETAMSLSKMNDIVSDDSPRHNEAIQGLKHDLSIFSKKPSYDQGFIVGGYSYAVAENATLAYVMGAAMSKAPIKSIASFEESFPGWYSTASKVSTLSYEAFEGGNVYVNFGDNFLGTYNYSAAGGLELDLTVPKSLQNKGLGSEIFAKAMNETGAQKVTATWVEGAGYENGVSDNLLGYRSALKEYGPTNAAWQTWTGRQAAKYGFKNVAVSPIRGGIKAIFTR